MPSCAVGPHLYSQMLHDSIGDGRVGRHHEFGVQSFGHARAVRRNRCPHKDQGLSQFEAGLQVRFGVFTEGPRQQCPGAFVTLPAGRGALI